MQPLRFATAAAPAEQRLALFRAGAAPYRIEALGSALEFAADWRVLALGDANALHAHVTPVSYTRTAAMIEADGEDRLVFFHVRRGRCAGVLDGDPVDLGPGDAMIWDLSCPLRMEAPTGMEVEAVTLPRFMVDEVLPGVTLSGAVPPSIAVTLVVEHLRFLFDRAGEMPDTAAPFQGRALRDMLAVALYPLYRARAAGQGAREGGRQERGGPATYGAVLHRILEHLDRRPEADWDAERLARLLLLPVAEVERTAARFGGLDELVERRRLLAAYRLLCDPTETAAISVVAHRCGFTDMPRFSRRFRAVFHTTASDLRRHHRAHLPAWAGAYHLEQCYAALVARRDGIVSDDHPLPASTAGEPVLRSY